MNGVLYVVTGEIFGRAAARSVRSLSKHCPDLPVRIFSDDDARPEIEKISVEGELTIGEIENPHIRSKIDYLSETPFERTLFLDSDTEVCAPIHDLFLLLERFDVGLAHAHRRYHENTEATWNIELPDAFPQYNSGVFVYRKSDQVWDFLNKWRESYYEANLKKDQVTLRELLWESGLRVATLPPEYNIRYEKYLEVWDKTEAVPKILHLRRFHEGGKECHS